MRGGLLSYPLYKRGGRLGEGQRLSQGHPARAEPQESGPNGTLLPGLLGWSKDGMHDGAASGRARGRFFLFHARSLRSKAGGGSVTRGGRSLHPGPGAIPTPGHSGGSPKRRRVPRPLLPNLGFCPAPAPAGPLDRPRPPALTAADPAHPLPSCDRAGRELTAPGPAGAGSGAAGLTQRVSGDPLQSPPSCRLAPA